MKNRLMNQGAPHKKAERSWDRMANNNDKEDKHDEPVLLNEIIKTIRFKDVEIEYLLTGEKNSETILFVHGLGANLSQFEQQQRYFSEKHTVLSVNLRGHGNSIIVHDYTPAEFELSKMSTDIIELLDSLNIEKVHFVGNSMGGNIGYEILKSKPEILESFTTFGTTGQLSTPKFSLGMMKFTYKLLSPKAIGNLSKTAGQTTNSREKIMEMMSQVNKSTILSIIPNLANFDYMDVIKTSQIQSMIIKGEKDKDINKAIKNTIIEFESRGDFKLYEMSKAGHFANLDNSDLFNRILEAFILNLNRVNN